jgi:hypothetical protein
VRRAIVICTLLLPQTYAAQEQASAQGIHVEVVATASEYVPHSTTVSHPGHLYTDCQGSTSYFGRFRTYGDSGSVSGTAETDTHCNTTFTPPTDATLTTYSRVNYTIARSDQALYLLSCTQTWKPSGKQRVLGALNGAAAGAAGRQPTDNRAQTAGRWTECPAFGVGSQYVLTVHNTSDARLENPAGGNPSKLEYLSSAALAVQATQPSQAQTQAARTLLGEARVHVTSSPSGGEIYVDGKFFGNTPSDITLTAGEHIFKITLGAKEWSRSVQVTSGEIRVHAEMAEP